VAVASISFVSVLLLNGVLPLQPREKLMLTNYEEVRVSLARDDLTTAEQLAAKMARESDWMTVSSSVQLIADSDSLESARIATEYQIQDFDVFSIGLETRCPVSTEPSVEIQRLRTCNNDGPKRPIETQRLFVDEISAGAETKKRETPPVSICPEPKDRIGLLFPRFGAS
jgi:hypothetical protein